MYFEFDVAKVFVGQEAKIKIAAYSNEEFTGKVYLVNNNSKIKITPVKTEAVGRDKLKVVEGLIEGDEVVVEGSYGLEDGEEVKVE